jgi:hypothetical protein
MSYKKQELPFERHLPLYHDLLCSETINHSIVYLKAKTKYDELKIEKTEGSIKNVQSRDTGNTGHTRHRRNQSNKHKNTTHHRKRKI